jgi:uncharacterized protein
MEPLTRHATVRVLDLLTAFPVVVVTGARQVGKSTLAAAVVDALGGRYVTLDEEVTLSRALADPEGLAGGAPGLLVIDEIQRAPDLMRAVKLSVDRDRRPGRFLLTGSANLLQLRTVGESLAGRSAWVELAPMTWSEIRSLPRTTILDRAFAAGCTAEFLRDLPPACDPLAAELRHRALAGGMPGTLEMSDDTRREWYAGYRTTFLERDLRQLARIEHLSEFGRLMSLALLRSGGLLNRSDLAADAGLDHKSASRYLGLLEVAYQIALLPPYFVNVGKRLVKAPKVLALDSGLVAQVAGLATWEGAVTAGRDGSLLETSVLDDLITSDLLSGLGSRHHYWRTSAGAEVDLVVEPPVGIVAVEVKSAATVRWRDLSGLRSLRRDVGERWRLGILAYTGAECRELDEGIVAVPLSLLLGAVSPERVSQVV